MAYAISAIEGFDHGEDHRLFGGPYNDVPSGTYSFVTSPRWGSYGYALRINPSSSQTSVGIGSRYPVGTLDYVQYGQAYSALFAFRLATAPSSDCKIVEWQDEHAYLTIGSDRIVDLVTPSGTDAGSTALSLDTWYLFAFRCPYGAGDAALTIYDSSGSSVETFSQAAPATTDPGFLRFRTSASATIDYYIDAVSIAVGYNVDLLSELGYGGNYRVGLLTPDTDGDCDYTWGTCTDYYDYQKVDEVAPDHCTTYIEMPTNSYGMVKCADVGSQLANVEEIDTVQIYCHSSCACVIDNSTNVSLTWKSGSASRASSSSFTNSAQWAAGASHQGKVFATDPADAAAWTITKVQSLQWGLSLGNDPKNQWTAAYIEMVYKELSSITPDPATAYGAVGRPNVVTNDLTLRGRVAYAIGATVDPTVIETQAILADLVLENP